MVDFKIQCDITAGSVGKGYRLDRVSMQALQVNHNNLKNTGNSKV